MKLELLNTLTRFKRNIYKEQSIKATVSIGLTTYRKKENIDSLLYKAKGSGRNKIEAVE